MDKLTVRISEGLLRGQKKKDLNGQDFFSFEGIPYGEPPVGNLRFKAPVPVRPWDGVKDALTQDLGNICNQEHKKMNPETGAIVKEFVIEGSEDCLNLNVFTRKLPNNESPQPKPVMFYVYGGDCLMGSTRFYGPEPLMTEDVVLVTVHYRVGALGFLVLSERELKVPGNAGLKDLVLALKWVQKNISSFNGDPSNVTIFGHSTGGSLVSYLLLSPTTSGLFHKAIIQSGGALNYWARGNPKNACHLAKALGCTKTNEEDILAFLQEMPARKLIEAQMKIGDTLDSTYFSYFSPVVEGKDCANTFITEEPVELLKSGTYNQVPCIIGYTDMESIDVLEQLETVFDTPYVHERVLPLLWLGFDKDSDDFKKIETKLRNFYYGGKKPDPISVAAVRFLSDTVIIRGVYKQTQHLAKSSKQPVYFYRLRTPMDNGEPFSSKKITGVSHGGELPFLFKMNIKTKLLTGNEKLFEKRILKLWTNFAKFGNPTPTVDDVTTIKWKPVNKDELNYLDIADDLSLRIDPDKESMAFWDEILQSFPKSKDY